MSDLQGIKVSPNPAKVGGTVTVTGDPGGQIYIGYKGKVTPQKLNARGTAVVNVPGEGGEEFTISDGGRPPSNVIVKIVSSIK